MVCEVCAGRGGALGAEFVVGGVEGVGDDGFEHAVVEAEALAVVLVGEKLVGKQIQ